MDSKEEKNFDEQAFEIAHAKDQIVNQFNLKVMRKRTLAAIDQNTVFKQVQQRNPVVIFPSLPLEAWDRLPRFTILSTNMQQNKIDWSKLG